MSKRKGVRLEHDERRRSILSAARRAFCAKPYSEVSMAELADAAGVARGLLHHYFGSKRELYLEVVRGIVRVPALPAAEVWEASVDGWMAWIESNAELWLAVVAAGGTGRDPELEEILDEAKELTAERALEALGLDPATVPPHVRALVRGYGGFADEITREWLVRERLSREEARAALVETLPLLLANLDMGASDTVERHPAPLLDARP